MTPKWQKLASLAQEISTLWFQFFRAVFASKGYPFKNILLFIVTTIVGVCFWSIFCCTLLYVPSSFSIILMGTRELVALLSLSS